MSSLGNPKFLSRSQLLRDLADLNRSISMFEQAVCLTPDGHFDQSRRLSNLGSSLHCRFERLGNLEDLNMSISMREKVLVLTPNGHPDKPARFSNLGNSLLTRFERLGDLADLNGSISKHEEAVYLTPDGHPDKPAWLNNLGSSFLIRFGRLGDLEDLNKSISKQEEAVYLTPDGHPDKQVWLNNFGSLLLIRFDRLGDLEDIKKSILMLDEAVCLTPDGHPDKPNLLNSLGNSIRRRFERLGDLVDLNRSISLVEEALCLSPDGHPDKPNLLNNLGSSLHRRFEHLGDLADLNWSISVVEEAVCLSPDGHPGKLAWFNRLGSSFLIRFGHLGDLEDLNKSISMVEEAVGDLADLNGSISKHEEVVYLTPDGHSVKPAWLNNLGRSLLIRFERLWDLDNLNRSISMLEKAIFLTPIKQSSQESSKLHADFLKRILKKLGQIGLSRLPEVHQHLIVPLTVLSRLASVSYMQQAFKNTDISLWMIKAFKETVGKADGGAESIFLFTSCIMKLATVVDAFNPAGAQAENLVTDGDARGQTPTPPVRMDSGSLLSFLLTKDIPATSEQVVYALKIMLANVDELPELASNLEFVNYILYTTGPGQVYSIQDIGSKVLVAACKHLILAHDAQSLARLATQCDLIRFLRRGIFKEDPPTILRDLLRNNDENFNADLLEILAPAVGDPFNTLLIKLRDEPYKIPEADLRDLEIALVLSNMEGKKRLLYDHLDRCIALMPLRDYKYTMALPLAVIVGWLLRRDGPLVSAARGEGVWKSFLRPNFEELLFPAWGDADLLEENPQMLRLLLDCSTQWLSTFAKSGTDSDSEVPSGSGPSTMTLRRLDGALDQLRSAGQQLSPDIKRALQKLSRQIKQYLPEEE